MDFYILKEKIEQSEHKIIPSNQYEDGRINSVNDEEEIKKFIRQLFPNNFIEAGKREWFDFGLSFDNRFYPFNIKSTNGKTADNVSSKEGLYFALTGRRPEQDGIKNFKNYNEKIIKYFNPECEEDYYFLVFIKGEKKVHLTSLKRLNRVIPNGNNLPFQVHWGKNNFTDSNRSKAEQGKYLLNKYIESFEKRACGLQYLLEWRETQ